MDTDQERQLAFMLASLNCARYLEASTHGALLPSAGVSAHSVRRDFDTLYRLSPEVLGVEQKKEVYPWVVRPEYEKRLRPEGPGGGEHRDFCAILHAGCEWASSNRKVDMPPDEFEEMFTRVTNEEDAKRKKREAMVETLTANSEQGKGLLRAALLGIAEIGVINAEDADKAQRALDIHPDLSLRAMEIAARCIASMVLLRIAGAEISEVYLHMGYRGGDRFMLGQMGEEMKSAMGGNFITIASVQDKGCGKPNTGPSSAS